MKWNSINRGSITLILASVVFIMMSMPLYASMSAQQEMDKMDMASHDYILDRQQSSNCSMVQMSDDELSNVTATGFSSFTLQDNIVKAYFNIEARTFTEVQSIKMGYYDDGTNGLGWDQNWADVSFGLATEDLICKGLYIEAKFTNITDAATRTLDCIKMGTPKMTGPIRATFNSFSGRIEDGNNVPVIVDGNPVDGRRITTLGTKTIYSNTDEFYIQLSRTGSQAGWSFFWKNATVTP
jgi:hypothetical protein